MENLLCEDSPNGIASTRGLLNSGRSPRRWLSLSHKNVWSEKQKSNSYQPMAKPNTGMFLFVRLQQLRNEEVWNQGTQGWKLL